ncbi:MAG: hypothetical protein Q9218_002663, partial [Villophora microphyllina]
MLDLGPVKETYYNVTAYNSTVTVGPTGKVVAHYRKRFLWYADEVWAQEGGQGFETVELDFPIRAASASIRTISTSSNPPAVAVEDGVPSNENPNPTSFPAPAGRESKPPSDIS